MKFNPTSEYEKTQLTIEDAKKILESNGYFVANLWHISDVMELYQCEEDTAQDILYKSLTNGHVMDAVWDSIDYMADDLNLERK